MSESEHQAPKPYTYDDERVTYFGLTDARGKRVKFGIKAKDRAKHMYVIGKTGMGKSTLLENLAIQDIQNGEGVAFIDPHGGTAEKLLDYVPAERVKDVLYFAPFDMEYPVSFNVMEDVGADKRHLVVNGLMSTFEKIWVDAWSARMAYILQNTLLALLEFPDSTLLGVNRMLADKEYRKRVVNNITDPSVKSFWTEEFAKYTERFAAEATPAIQNKIGQFTSNPLVRNIIGQPKSSFDIRKMMDERKILIVNLSKGRVGEGNAKLLGGMLITKIYLAAMSRADVSASTLRKLPNFYLYVDEFQSFANKSFADILSEARKYKLNLTIAHQYIEQMEEEVRDAVFGNVGSTLAFRVGPFDAEVLETVFAPQFEAEDLVNLGLHQIYLSLMIDGVGSPPFSANSMPPIEAPLTSYKDMIIANSRKAFGHPRAEVEEEIKHWHEVQPEIGTPPLTRLAEKAPEKVAAPAPRSQVSPSASPQKSSVPVVSSKQPSSQEPHKPQVQIQVPAQRPAPTPPSAEKKAEAAHLRELELRRAVSFNQVRQEPRPQQKKDQHKPQNNGKGPTEKNLSDLRSALASVMKDVRLLEKKPESVQNTTPSAPKVHQEPQKKEQSSGEKPLSLKDAILKAKQEYVQAKPELKVEQKSESIREAPAKPLESSGGKKEVSKEVLENILKEE